MINPWHLLALAGVLVVGQAAAVVLLARRTAVTSKQLDITVSALAYTVRKNADRGGRS